MLFSDQFQDEKSNVMVIYFLYGFKFLNQYCFFCCHQIQVKFSVFSFSICFIISCHFISVFLDAVALYNSINLNGTEAAVDLVSIYFYLSVTCAIFCVLIIRYLVNVSFWRKLVTGTGQSFATKIAGLFYLLYRVQESCKGHKLTCKLKKLL